MMICSICQLPIESKGSWTMGNNAEPVNDGRCCDGCDNAVVIPARINQLRMKRALQEAIINKANDND